MTWLKLDDNFFGDPKIVAAGRDARDLFLSGLTYCARHLTDGRIPVGALARIAADAEVVDAPALAQRLVDVELWARNDSGFNVPKYLKYNPSAEQIKTERDAARRRKGGHDQSSPGFRANSGSSAEKEGPKGHARIPGSPARIDPVPSPEEPVVAPVGASEPRAPVVDDEFKRLLEDEFCEAIGSREAVRDRIAAALGHKARLNYTDLQAYLRNWLRGDVERHERQVVAPNGHSPPARRHTRYVGEDDDQVGRPERGMVVTEDGDLVPWEP